MQSWQKEEIDAMIGRRYNLLAIMSVHSYDDRPGHSKDSRMLCECTCGNRTIVSVNDLKHGKVRSCKCLQKLSAKKVAQEKAYKVSPGEVFSIYKVLEFSRYETLKGNIYICECECGAKVEKTVRQLRFYAAYPRRRKCFHIRVERKHGLVSADLHYAYKIFFKTCVLCGSEELPEIDHVIPRKRGGLGEPGNIVRLCRSCNRSKGDSDLKDLPDRNREILTYEAGKFSAYVGQINLVP